MKTMRTPPDDRRKICGVEECIASPFGVIFRGTVDFNIQGRFIMKNSLCHLLAIMATCATYGCSQNATAVTSHSVAVGPRSSRASLPLRATMDLGVVDQGESAKSRSWVRNQSKVLVDVSRIKSSCECLEVRLSKTQIPPGERTLASLHYDGAREPDFVGTLQIEVELIDDKGTVVGHIDVPVEVIRAAANANAGW